LTEVPPSRPHATAGMIAGMSIVLPALTVAFAAFCVWLAVRIYNRRERWAKWTAVGMVVTILVGYPLSFGPACWISSRMQPSGNVVSAIYWPFFLSMWQGPDITQEALQKYVHFGMPYGFGYTLSDNGIEFRDYNKSLPPEVKLPATAKEI